MDAREPSKSAAPLSVNGNGLSQIPCRIDDARVIEQVQQYRAALLEGRQPQRESLLEKYPQIARELSACLDGLEMLRRVAPQMKGQDGSPDPETSRRVPGELGDFRILREIGRGGMGVVYEVEQISLGRRMALKVLPFAEVLDERQLARFRNEALFPSVQNSLLAKGRFALRNCD